MVNKNKALDGMSTPHETKCPVVLYNKAGGFAVAASGNPGFYDLRIALSEYWNLDFACLPVCISLGAFGKKHLSFLGQSWKRHLTRHMTLLALSRLSEKCNGLCLKTGAESNLTVIDSDDNMNESLLRHFKQFLSAVPTVKTPRGFHLYFSYEPLLKSAVYSEIKLDIKNDGGLVIAPPSKYSDKSYSWINPLEGELKPMPDELLYFLMENQVENKARKPADKARKGLERKIKKLHELTDKQRHCLHQCLSACANAPLHYRSGHDFYLCLFSIRAGLEKNVLWLLCKDKGKFKTDGISYFEYTYGNALKKM